MKMSEKQRNFERLSESQNCCTRPVLKIAKKRLLGHKIQRNEGQQAFSTDLSLNFVNKRSSLVVVDIYTWILEN